MGLKAYNLPDCDQCGKPWLPDEGPARQDIRAYDAAERAKGKDGNPVRCAKCKSKKWDENYRKSLENGPVEAENVPEVTQQDVIQTLDLPEIPRDLFQFADDAKKISEIISAGGKPPKLCRHRVMNCGICSK